MKWLIEWMKSTLTRNNLAAPRILHVAFVAKCGKWTRAPTSGTPWKTCLVTKLSGDFITRWSSKMERITQKQVVSEQKHVWPDSMTGICPLVICSPVLFHLIISAVNWFHELWYVKFSFWLKYINPMFFYMKKKITGNSMFTAKHNDTLLF